MAKSKYSLLKKKKIKVTRRSGPTHDPITGYPTQSRDSEFYIEGHYYPLDDYHKKLLPEGVRSKGTKRLHTPIQYLLRSTEEFFYPDRVTLGDQLYEVQNRETFDMGVLDHHEYLLVLVETSGGAKNVTGR